MNKRPRDRDFSYYDRWGGEAPTKVTLRVAGGTLAVLALVFFALGLANLLSDWMPSQLWGKWVGIVFLLVGLALGVAAAVLWFRRTRPARLGRMSALPGVDLSAARARLLSKQDKNTAPRLWPMPAAPFAEREQQRRAREAVRCGSWKNPSATIGNTGKQPGRKVR